MKSHYYISLLLIYVIFIAGCNLSVNKTVHIKDGETVSRSLNSVNGGIIIGSNCRIDGNCRSVNGSIEVGSDSEVQSLETVNGRIEIGEAVNVDGNVKSINGGVTCDAGVGIDGYITSINGSIDLRKTTVEQDLNTYNGDITLMDRCLIHGDIIIKKSKGNSDKIRRLKIKITDNSVVEGDIVVKDRDVEVKVYLSQGGKVNGKIENAEIIEK